MASATPNVSYLFFAETMRGYTFKVTIDSLAIAMPRTKFQITKEGLFCRASDEAEQILYDINFPRDHFRSYRCSVKTGLMFSVNLKHLQKMVRNVKKKDSIVIFIQKDAPDRLYVAIKPSGSSSGQSSRIETLFVTINLVTDDELMLALPEIYVDENGEEIEVYNHPKTIESGDFQKMKKMTTLGKLVKVSMQKGNYISFCSDNGQLYGSHLEFGELLKDEDFSDEESEKEQSSEMYEAEFHMSIFSLLMKLPGLCKLMNFYAPRIPRYPLKIQMNAENLGKITIYIKDALQIAYEQNERERKEREKNEDSEYMHKPAKKKKL